MSRGSGKRGRQKIKSKLLQYLSGKYCADCKNTNIIVFEFDHVRGDKRDDISKMMKNGSWAKIEDELKKCDVVCANCHRIRTAIRNMDYRARFAGLVSGGQIEMGLGIEPPR